MLSLDLQNAMPSFAGCVAPARNAPRNTLPPRAAHDRASAQSAQRNARSVTTELRASRIASSDVLSS